MLGELSTSNPTNPEGGAEHFVATWRSPDKKHMYLRIQFQVGTHAGKLKEMPESQDALHIPEFVYLQKLSYPAMHMYTHAVVFIPPHGFHQVRLKPDTYPLAVTS